MFKFTMNMNCSASRAFCGEAMSACAHNCVANIILLIAGISVLLMSVFVFALLINAELLISLTGITVLVGILFAALIIKTGHTPERALTAAV